MNVSFLSIAATWGDFLVFGVYMAIIIGIAVYSNIKSKSAKTVDSFLLGGNKIGGIMAAFAYGTTYFSAVIFIGYAGKNGFTFGLGALWIGVGNAVLGSFLAWQVLAKRTRRLTRVTGARTMPEMLEKRYQSKYIKLVSAIIIFIFLVPYAASVYQGLGYLFEVVFGIPFYGVVLIMACLTTIYLFLGGYLATVFSDFFQGLIMLVGCFLMVYFVVNAEQVGGFISGIDKLMGDKLGFFPSISNTDGSPNSFTLIMLVILTSLGTWGLPQMVHKFHTVSAEKAIKKAKFISTGFALIIGVSAYFVGCLARYILGVGEVGGLLSESGGADKIMPMVFVQTLDAGLLGLIVVLIMSASMSTLAALSLSSSSAVAIDFYKGYINKNASDKKINRILRGLCIVFIGVSVLIAILKPAGIIELMSLSWGMLSGCFLAPYIYGLYSKKATKAGAYSSLITAAVTTLVLYIVYSVLSGPIKGYFAPPTIGVSAMILGLIVMPIVSHFSKKTMPSNKLVEPLFAIYSKKQEPTKEELEQAQIQIYGQKI